MSSTRWKEITEAIHADIVSGKLQSGDRLPAEGDLAAQWNVCRMTAHRALAELQRQGWVTRQPRRGTVVSVSPHRRTGHIALLFSHINEFPQAEYIQGVRAALPDNYHLLFCDTGSDPEREAQYLRRMQKEADGILCYPTCAPENTPLMRSLVQAGTPIVCLDRIPQDLDVDAAVTDNYGSTLEALRALAARGHRRIAHFTDDNLRVSSVRERYEAYHQVMREAGAADMDRWVRLFPRTIGGDFDRMVQVVEKALSDLLGKSDPPTAVFCLKDHYLSAVLEACDRLKIAVPEELEIVSFSDYPPLVQRLSHDVHRITQQGHQMGQAAAKRLLDRLGDTSTASQVIRVPAQYHPAVTPARRYTAPLLSTVSS